MAKQILFAFVYYQGRLILPKQWLKQQKISKKRIETSSGLALRPNLALKNTIAWNQIFLSQTFIKCSYYCRDYQSYFKMSEGEIYLCFHLYCQVRDDFILQTEEAQVVHLVDVAHYSTNVVLKKQIVVHFEVLGVFELKCMNEILQQIL